MGSIDTVLFELRTFEPGRAFAAEAHIGNKLEYDTIWRQAQADPVSFWEEAARNITWFSRWKRPLIWKEPYAHWFEGGTTNAAYNCLDRHLKEGLGSKTAVVWEGEDGSSQNLTYQELYEKVCQLSNVLETKFGLKPGDTAAIYMPLVPEAIIAMLACARIGVVHSVIFAGFSGPAIRDRVQDAECKVILTADIGYRRGQEIELLKIIDSVMSEMPTVQNILVLKRKSDTVLKDKHQDWNLLVNQEPKTHFPKPFDSEHPLFLLYTSGTTGKPKGIIHSTGGYLVGVSTTAKWIFDLKMTDIFWCTADIGWITGHSYVVYGLLSHGATIVLYEGAPFHPHPGRFWEIIDKHKVSILYTAPTAIRAFMRAGNEHPRKYQLSTLRLLGSVGEPINPEAWMWYHTEIGKERCPIVDTWWQTETGCILISPLPGVTTTRPGSATKPFPGIVADVVNEEGKSCAPNDGGYLVIKHPWPSMLRGIYKNPERYKEAYWTKFPGMYFTGDSAHRDDRGYFWIKGRVDDVINVSGHRLGTMEVESALVSHPAVAEAAVVGRPDPIKGQALVAFVTPRGDENKVSVKELVQELKEHVSREIGAIARPDEIKITRTLPKTRSGKIMRRLLKDLAEGKEPTGDTTTLENPALIELIED
ncbi:MAG: acetate--CoA ligase [Proteobacteria bacterium]|nr:acetate--CoA ligase [Pseudomonadota bacterium]